MSHTDIANEMFIDSRMDGHWLVCVGRVHDTMEEAQKECRAWIDAYRSAHQPVATEDERALFEKTMRELSNGEPDWNGPTGIWCWRTWQAARGVEGRSDV